MAIGLQETGRAPSPLRLLLPPRLQPDASLPPSSPLVNLSGLCPLPLLSLSCSVHVCVRRLYPELVFWRNVFLASWLTESLIVIVLGVHHPDSMEFLVPV